MSVPMQARAVAEQGGIISGQNPTAYSSTDPLKLWIIQVGIIIAFTQLLGLAFKRIRQPRVIAEVIGGVLLGPSVMGRIPNFTNRIFPTLSIPILTLTANIGLVFFLFLVGLELDTRVVKRQAKVSAAISAAGLIIPLGLGAAVAVPIYHQFVNPSVQFGDFVLFVAVSVGITAFPVLCRILTELRILDTPVGVAVLSAGIGNDVVGWILLALTVALVNASNGLTALWVLLASTGYVLFMVFPMRWALKWLARKTGSIESGQPSTLMMIVTLIIVLASAFFTDIIGVHPIFGGFVAGLIVPHDGGLAISITEKLEDFVTLLFLPLYFAQSGLNTNLGLLDNGITWGYVVLICTISFVSKFSGSFIAARLTGFNFREAGAIGTLMSCKGLVELIALNIGFQAGILDTRTFSMFVLHAIVLTFMTSPLTQLWYPRRLHKHIGGQHGDIESKSHGSDSDTHPEKLEPNVKSHFTVVVDRMDYLPAVMTITQIIHPQVHSAKRPLSQRSVSDIEVSGKELKVPPVKLHALRLVELSDRTSGVMKSQEVESLARRDPVISVVRTLGRLQGIPVMTALSVLPQDDFPSRINSYVKETMTQMTIIPWMPGSMSAENTEPSSSSPVTPSASTFYNPFETLFSGPGHDNQSAPYMHFVRRMFNESVADIAAFIDYHPVASDMRYGQHIFLPFFGGPDDRLALNFVIQLCANPDINATIMKITEANGDDLTTVTSIIKPMPYEHEIHSYTRADTQTRLASTAADHHLWDAMAASSSPHSAHVQAALKRITFRERVVKNPLHAVIDIANEEIKQTADSWKAPLLIMGRSRNESHYKELKSIIAERAAVNTDIHKTFGEVASAFLVSNTPAKLLVVQAASEEQADAAVAPLRA